MKLRYPTGHRTIKVLRDLGLEAPLHHTMSNMTPVNIASPPSTLAHAFGPDGIATTDIPTDIPTDIATDIATGDATGGALTTDNSTYLGQWWLGPWWSYSVPGLELMGWCFGRAGGVLATTANPFTWTWWALPYCMMLFAGVMSHLTGHRSSRPNGLRKVSGWVLRCELLNLLTSRS